MKEIKVLDDHRFTLRGKEFRPLMVGGMGVDISTSALALEAARLGAIGHISDAMSPYVADRKFRTKFQHSKMTKFRALQKSDPDVHIQWDPVEVYKAQLLHIGSTMEAKRGSGGVFVNVMEKLTMGAPKETLRARLQGALDAGIDGITLSAGLHNGTLALIEDHPRFRDAVIGIIVSSARALKIFLRGAARVNRLPDYIVVEGPLAGGHLGFGEDWREHDLRTIVREVLDMLKEESLNIPVIPAGGVFTGRDAVEMINLGASAVQVATRFTISRECGLPDHVKQVYLRSDEEDVEVNMASPTGYPMRMLKQSPSLRSNIAPSCESLGYILDGKGQCAYRTLWHSLPDGPNGEKAPIREKMCICHHFMRFQCYTCGHNVFRLKDTTKLLANGKYFLPTAEHIILDYLTHLQPAMPVIPEDEVAPLQAVA